MKAILLLSALVLSATSTALPLSPSNLIIDPPRSVKSTEIIKQPASFHIVTPNEGPDTGVETPTLENPFPGQAYIPPTTTEDSIVRARKISVSDEDDADDEDEEYDPEDPETLNYLLMEDKRYEQETGMSAYPTGKTVDRGNIDPAVLLGHGTPYEGMLHYAAGCTRATCSLWAHVNKRTQTVRIYVNGAPIALPDSRVSTSLPGQPIRKNGRVVRYTSETPNFDKHPDGRVYIKYTSRTYPGGDWKGLGNMPYAVFISGGYAMHGTPSIGKLGRKASHGCIRMNPATGKLFNSLVRQYGVSDTWITVD